MGEQWTIAPAAKAALEQATRAWPDRRRVHDGTIGDYAHSTRKSDHNPDEDGVVLAFDLTDDPARGCDAHKLVRAAVSRRDRRIKYVISEGRIWSADRYREGWRRYSGSNPHDKHAHVSINKQHANDTSPWWVATPDPVTPEEDMTPAEWTKLEELLDKKIALILRGDATHPHNLEAIHRDVHKPGTEHTK